MNRPAAAKDHHLRETEGSRTGKREPSSPPEAAIRLWPLAGQRSFPPGLVTPLQYQQHR
jgi:hypothetical protein